MPTPTNKVELLIAGNAHGDWSSYEIDSDLLTPADAWQVSLGMSGGQMPPDVAVGAPVEVRVDGETVMVGHVDEIDHSVSKGGHSLSMSGRDRAADLLDCACPIFTKEQASLSQIIAAIVRAFNITKTPVINSSDVRPRKKVAVSPGESAWNTLVHAAEANGLWPWFEPDGTLMIGGPDYTVPEVATLILRRDGKDNNVISLRKNESMAERYSRVTVYGQSPGSSGEPGRPNLYASELDGEVLRDRPKMATDSEADSFAVCRDRARKLISDSKLSGFTLSAVVQGHRIVAPGQIADGKLWKPGQRIRVNSEPHGINDEVFFLIARKFTRGRNDGTRTTLTLKKDGVWLPYAHPHNKQRRGKNSLLGRAR
jgi:prophage tail gpP-like protein